MPLPDLAKIELPKLSPQGAAHQHRIGVDALPAFGVLVAVVLALQYGPGFFVGYQFHPLQNGIRHFRAAIGKAFAFPLGRQKNQFVFRDLPARAGPPTTSRTRQGR